jgi:hypothetical protein
MQIDREKEKEGKGARTQLLYITAELINYYK